MSLNRLVAITKALADPNRVRALMACRYRELCVCQIVELLDLAPSTVSKHLAILRQAGLLTSRKKGRWIHYRIPESDPSSLVRDAHALVKRSLARDSRMRDDRKRIEAILRLDTDELCLKQRCRPPSKSGA
jgi:DNA-binding transcriptional ArsR family regulator